MVSSAHDASKTKIVNLKGEIWSAIVSWVIVMPAKDSVKSYEQIDMDGTRQLLIYGRQASHRAYSSDVALEQ